MARFVITPLMGIVLLALIGVSGVFGKGDFREMKTQAFHILSTGVKTTLPDGRIRWQHDADYFDETLGAHVSYHADGIHKAHWKMFDLSQHSSMEGLRCHDLGDKNLRMTVTSPSTELLSALTSDAQHVVLRAPSQHRCHGRPIARIVQKAIVNPNNANEVQLYTRKMRYQEVFDDLDVKMSAGYPQNLIVTPRTDYGADIRFEKPEDRSTVAFPRSTELWDPEDRSGARNATTSKRRMNEQWGWHSFTSWVSHAATTVATTVVTAVKAAANYFVGGVEVLGSAASKAVKTLTDLVSITFDQTYSAGGSVSFNGARSSYAVGQVNLVPYMNFGLTFNFALNIQSNSLKLVSSSVTGSLTLAISATYSSTLCKDWTYDRTLLTIEGPSIDFEIGPVPVVVESEFPVEAGIDATVCGSGTLTLGFQYVGSATIGGQYTPSNGFQLISGSSDSKTASFSVSNLAAWGTVSPSITAGVEFTIDGLLHIYGGPKYEIETPFTTAASGCDIQVTATGSLGMEIKGWVALQVASFTIFSQTFVEQDIEFVRTPLISYCNPSGHSSGRHFEQMAIGGPIPQTIANGSDSGKTWKVSTNIAPAVKRDFSLSGFFWPNGSIFLVMVMTNDTTTVPHGVYTSQRLLMMTMDPIAAGATVTLIPADAGFFNYLGYNATDSAFSSGDPTAVPINFDYLTLQFASDSINTVSVVGSGFNAQMRTMDLSSNQTDVPALLASLMGASGEVEDNFIAAVKVGVIIAAIVVVLDLVLSCVLCRNYPKTKPSKLEWARMGVILLAFLLAGALLFGGWGTQYMEIQGVYVDNSRNAWFDYWTFQLTSVTRKQCPLQESCAPYCASLCTSQTVPFQQAPWPFCPYDNVLLCAEPYPWAVFLFCVAAVFFTAMTMWTSKSPRAATQRLFLSSVFLCLAAVSAYLVWQKILQYLTDIYQLRFTPTPNQVYPYVMAINGDANRMWKGMAAFLVLAILISFVMLAIELYQRFKAFREHRDTEAADSADMKEAAVDLVNEAN